MSGKETTAIKILQRGAPESNACPPSISKPDQAQAQTKADQTSRRAKGTAVTLADLLSIAVAKKQAAKAPPPPTPIKQPHASNVHPSKTTISSMVLPEGLRLKGSAKREKPSRMKKLVRRTRADVHLKAAQEAHDEASKAFDSLADACLKLLDELTEVEGGTGLQEMGDEKQQPSVNISVSDQVKVEVLRQAIAHAEKRLRSAAELMESSEKRLEEAKALCDKAYNVTAEGNEDGKENEEEEDKGEEEEEREPDADQEEEEQEEEEQEEDESHPVIPAGPTSKAQEGAVTAPPPPSAVALMEAQPVKPSGPNLLGLSLFDDDDDDDDEDDGVDGLRGWTDVMGKWTGTLGNPGASTLMNPRHLFAPLSRPQQEVTTKAEEPPSPVSTTLSVLDPEVAVEEISSQSSSIRSKIVGDGFLSQKESRDKQRPNLLQRPISMTDKQQHVFKSEPLSSSFSVAPASSPSNFGLSSGSIQPLISGRSIISADLPSEWSQRQAVLSQGRTHANRPSSVTESRTSPPALFESVFGPMRAKQPGPSMNPHPLPQVGTIAGLLEALSTAAASNPLTLHHQAVQKQPISRPPPPSSPHQAHPSFQGSMSFNAGNNMWGQSYQPQRFVHPMQQQKQPAVQYQPVMDRGPVMTHTAQPFVPLYPNTPLYHPTVPYPQPFYFNQQYLPAQQQQQQQIFRGNGEHECAICGIQCNSSQTFQQHLESKKHLTKAARQAVADAEAASQALEGAVSSTRLQKEQVHPLCKQVVTKVLNEAAVDLLTRLKGFHDRAYAKNPIKANAHKLFLCGLREVKKAVKQGKAKAVIVAPNIEQMEAVVGGLDDHLHDIITVCSEQNVPCVFALSRKRLGRVYGSRKKVSAVALLDIHSLEEIFGQILVLAAEGRSSFEHLSKSGSGTPNVLEDPEAEEEEDGEE